jgi:ferredoxin-NADP reductase/phenylpropionate dioxygenase-like ring-hydroxylating dioxygenase large terminal subunit
MSREHDNAANIFAALDRGESLPAHWYTDPGITEREVQEIFRKSWNYIGPASELKNVGDYITGYAGMLPVVVIRNEEGLAGFVNVCRHRRHEVMKGRGNAKIMTCAYHAWAYDLSGCLKRAPRSAAEKGFRLEDYPLLAIRAEALGPFVFVNADPDAPPVASYYGGLLDIIAQSGIQLDTLQLYSRSDWRAPANWKTMLENYLECYHCPVAHPGFSAAIDVAPENYNLTAHGWYMSQTGYVRDSALQGKTAVKIYDARGELRMAQYHVLFPNFTININPGFTNMSVDVWRPDGPNHCEGFSEQYFGAGVSEAFATELIEFNTQVGIEDDDLTNSVQRGLIGGLPERGRTLTNSEHLVVHFQRLVANALTRATDAEQRPVESRVIPISTSISVNPTESAVPEAEKNAHVQLAVLKVERESDVISSFYLQRVDGAKLGPWEPGQFLPIRVKIPGQAQPAMRTYTLSTCANPDHYRLSIRRLDPSLVSKFLHDNAKPGVRVEAMAPRGKFVLDQASARPAVLVSGGVGITPMIAIAEHIVAEGKRTGSFRPVYFIHGSRSGAEHAFAKHVRALAADHPQMHVHFAYSKPGKGDKLGATHHSEGHVTMDTLKGMLPFGDYDFYLCGPSEFMSSLYTGLTAMNVPPERIHYESFGPGSVLKPVIAHKAVAAEDAEGIARVRFAKSGIDAVWSRDKGNLLELAEEAGIAAAFGCRSGVCGTCTTTIRSGAVDYIEEPLVERAGNEVLLCCSLPRRSPGHRADSHEPDLVLEL